MVKNRHLINRMIVRCIFEIVLLVVFLIVSYKGFTAGNLSDASQIASLSENESREVQAVYTYGKKAETRTIDDGFIIDEGVLALKNPNKVEKKIGLLMHIRKSDDLNIGDLNIKVNGKDANMGIIMSLDDAYEINLGEVTLDSYEYDTIPISIQNKSEYKKIEYSVKLVGNF